MKAFIFLIFVILLFIILELYLRLRGAKKQISELENSLKTAIWYYDHFRNKYYNIKNDFIEYQKKYNNSTSKDLNKSLSEQKE